MKIKILKYLFAALMLVYIPACKKSTFLNTRPDQSLVVPSTVQDLQAILDNDQRVNGTAGLGGSVPSLGEVGADNYYVSDEDLNNNAPYLEQNAYIWAQKIYSGETVPDWDFPYRTIFYANTALDGLAKITGSYDQAAWNNVKGSALFYRAHIFYQLAQLFAPPYDSQTAAADWGIPLRLQADINEKISRSSVKQTYEKVINDLREALPLLPAKPLYLTRPSKPAVYSLLARVYQTMQDYENALLYADSCLQWQHTLLDFNSLDPGQTFPIPQLNDETIFYCIQVPHTLIYPFLTLVDSNLYNSYALNDLRRSIFFTPAYSGTAMTFQGSYDGSGDAFGGLATDEVYLIRAECYARKDNTAAAMNDLNTLLEKRWITGTFIPFTASDAADALMQILTERRKELLFRALRWTDLRRLNKEASFAVQLVRVANGISYTLPPGDIRYTYPIPDNVISFNPGMPQNPR